MSLPPMSALFPYTTLFRSRPAQGLEEGGHRPPGHLRTRNRILARTHGSLRVLGSFGHNPKCGGSLRFWKDLVTDRKSTRLNSSHVSLSYAVFRLKKKTKCH